MHSNFKLPPVLQLVSKGRRQNEDVQFKRSAEIVRVQTAAFDDVLERADGGGLAAVLSDDGLPSVRVMPFLVAAMLVHEESAVSAEHSNDFLGMTNWEAPTQGRASSTSLAFLRNLTGLGSNQMTSDPLALAMASLSVSPAVAQPGNSGNTAAQRFVRASNSTSHRDFMSGGQSLVGRPFVSTSTGQIQFDALDKCPVVGDVPLA